MIFEYGGEISCTDLLQPKVEAEIAFKFKEETKRSKYYSRRCNSSYGLYCSVSGIFDGFIKKWQINPEDAIANNASSGLYLSGGTLTKIDDIDLELMEMAFF